MVIFKFNPAETGLRKTLREYEEIALRYIWSLGEEGAGSGKTWEHVNEELGEGKSISRASVIFYLNRMVDQSVRARIPPSGQTSTQKAQEDPSNTSPSGTSRP